MKNISLFAVMSVGSCLTLSYVKNNEKQKLIAYEKLSEKEKYEYEIMAFALRNNAFYQSGQAHLQRMAMDFYKSQPQMRTQAKFWLEYSEGKASYENKAKKNFLNSDNGGLCKIK